MKSERIEWSNWADKEIVASKKRKENFQQAFLLYNRAIRSGRIQLSGSLIDPDIYVIAVTGVTPNEDIDQWWADVRTAVDEGKRVGIDIRMAYASETCGR